MQGFRPLLLTTLGALTLTVGACGEDAPERDARDPGPAATTPRDGADASEKTSAGAGGLEGGGGGASPPPTSPARGQVRTVASGLEVPWDIAFMPDGAALVSERDRGDIVRVPAGGGAGRRFMTVPGVEAGGEGGLLGLAVSPRFSSDRTIFAYLTAAEDNRVVAIDTTTKDATPILTGLAKGQIHNGGALEFGPDGKLYVGVGETGEPGVAQDRSSRNGKILRIDPDGSVPAGNPFPGSPVWSLGHRNVQGFAWDSRDRMWATEFGQNAVDEVNLITKGSNYGWPEVEGRGGGNGAFVDPAATWSPTSTSSPSGAAIAGDQLYVGALAGRTLWQVTLDGRAVSGDPKSLFPDRYGRIRGVVTAPNGAIWFTTSNTDGRGDPRDGDDRIVELGV